jgi:hypothetical protein
VRGARLPAGTACRRAAGLSNILRTPWLLTAGRSRRQETTKDFSVVRLRTDNIGRSSLAPIRSNASIPRARGLRRVCDRLRYLPTEKVKIPAELALLIIRKASAMAATFEEQALDQLTKDALQALRQGADPQKLIREMRL